MIQENCGGSPASIQLGQNTHQLQRETPFTISVQDENQIMTAVHVNPMEAQGYQQMQYEQEALQQFMMQQRVFNYQQQHVANFNYNEDNASNNGHSNAEQSEPSIPSIPSHKDAAMIDAGNTSDATTVDDAINDTEISPSDPFPYLLGLNSDNLMQFSQQSALQELMLKEQLDTKPNLHVLPTFEEHDFGGYKFQVNLDTKRRGKSSGIYSETLNKIYVRMNEIFSIDAVYTPKMPLQQLRVRALLSFVKEVSEPVLRCQNHISKDSETQPKLLHSLLRCENPYVEYCGSSDGKNINERYSVLIPLGTRVAPNNDSTISQTIALKCTCQNSCIGRKETSIIFLLEGMNGEVLSQRVLDVKICSCPKRDKAMDERNVSGRKRKMSDDFYPSGQKVRRDNSSTVSMVKKECSVSDLEENADTASKHCDVVRTASGGFRVSIEVPSKEIALDVSNFAVMRMMLFYNFQDRAQCPRPLKRLKRLIDRVHKA